MNRELFAKCWSHNNNTDTTGSSSPDSTEHEPWQGHSFYNSLNYGHRGYSLQQYDLFTVNFEHKSIKIKHNFTNE